MGENIVQGFRKHFLAAHKVAFLSAFVIGLLIHFYKFTNFLLNLDALGSFYSPQNILQSGRWFLEIACAPSSFFNLPWVTGLFSLFWIAMTTVVIVDLFQMRDPVLIVLTGGLMAAFPSVTELFFYQFTADGYMFAMFLAAFSVRLTVIGQKKVSHWISAGICLCLACGVYQIYVCFAIVLLLLLFANSVLQGEHAAKTYFRWGGAQIGLYAVSMALYFVIWKICLAVQHVHATGYQGIKNAGIMSAASIATAVKMVVTKTLSFFEIDILHPHEIRVTWLSVLQWIFLAALIGCVVAAFIRSGIRKDKLRTVLFVIGLAAVPFAIYIWYFISSVVDYNGYRMEHGFVLLYIFAGVLFERYAHLRWKNAAALLFAAIILFNGIVANIHYFYMERNYDKALSEATEMATRIHMVDEGTAKYLVIVGKAPNAVTPNYIDKSVLGNYANLELNNLLCNEFFTSLAIANLLDFQLKYYVDHPQEKASFYGSETSKDGQMTSRFSLMEEPQRQELVQSQAVRQMENWPAPNSVAVIGDAVVLKYTDEAG